MFPEAVTSKSRDGLFSCLPGCHGLRIIDSGAGRGMSLNAGWRCACTRQYGLGSRMFMVWARGSTKVPQLSGLVLSTTPACHSPGMCKPSADGARPIAHHHLYADGCSRFLGTLWTSTWSHLGSSRLSCRVAVSHPMGALYDACSRRPRSGIACVADSILKDSGALRGTVATASCIK